MEDGDWTPVSGENTPPLLGGVFVSPQSAILTHFSVLPPGGWRMEDGDWGMEDGGWRMEDWRMEDGGWRMESGGGRCCAAGSSIIT